MSDDKTELRIAAAQERADAARTRLGETIGELKHRVSPQTLAQDAADSIKDRGMAATHALVATARQRPAVVAAVVGGVALFLLRHRVAALARRATGSAPESSPSRANTKKGPAR